MAIRSFASDEVEEFFAHGRFGKGIGWSSVASIVARKLDMMHYARELRDLKSPPGNRLEALSGKWTGYYSIRVNDRWRIVFHWSDLGAEDVDVVDYH
ncbi:MAG: type II toxin-antitoxin system RelE/ParE family toxin [Thermoanaerobaculia bacterium]